MMVISCNPRFQTYAWTPLFSNFSVGGRMASKTVRIQSMSKSKKANLSATRKERIKLLDSDGKTYPRISEFLNHPSGIQALLNTSALQSFQFLAANTYRCTLPKVQLLNFEATPVMDLRVIPMQNECTVELLSCKFEGSDILEQQNDLFSAVMTNHITWDTNDPEPFLEVDVELNLSLEIYTRPFIFLPTSAVEGPGNLMLQALMDRLVPILLQQLIQDCENWDRQKFHSIHEFGQDSVE